MAKMVLSALLRSHKAGVKAEVAEFPEVEVTGPTVGGVLARLRAMIKEKMFRTEVETSCSGHPLSPVPESPSGSEELTVPLEVEVAKRKST